MKYALTLLLLTFSVPFCIAQQPVPVINMPKIDSLCNQVLKDQYIPGFAVAVVKGNQVVYSKGFGYRDVVNKKPVTPNTLFAIGSCTKAFTCGLLGQLQDEGKLSIDNKATSYLPELRFFNDEMNNNITVRDMMCHRTGLSRYDHAWYVFNTSNRDSLIKRVRYMEPSAGLRQKFQYNNFMFLAQGMIAEKLTGKAWEQNIREKFFRLLDMKRSNTSIGELQADTNASLPYKVDKDTVIKKMAYYNIDGMGPAGSINSCVNDMANWLKVWINDGKYNGKQVLPQWYVNEASGSQMVISGERPGIFKDIYFNNYGLGWMISSYRGHYRVEHGGAIDGFRSSVAFFPADSLGIIVLSNQNSSAVPDLLVKSISELTLGIEPIDWISDARKKLEEKIKKNRSAKKITAGIPAMAAKPSHPLNEYIGMFSNAGYGDITVFMKNDSLFANAGKFTVWLKHRHYDVFDMLNEQGNVTEEDSYRLNFLTGYNGRVEGANVTFGIDKPVVFKYQVKEIKLETKQLEKYAGNYGTGALTIKVYIKDGHLQMSVPEQGDFELYALDNHTFALRIMEGYFIKFDNIDKGNIAALTTIMPERSERFVRKNK